MKVTPKKMMAAVKPMAKKMMTKRNEMAAKLHKPEPAWQGRNMGQQIVHTVKKSIKKGRK